MNVIVDKQVKDLDEAIAIVKNLKGVRAVGDDVELKITRNQLCPEFVQEVNIRFIIYPGA